MKKLIAILFLCSHLCHSAAIVKTVEEDGGGDYTTLEACMNANEQDLTDAGGDTFTVLIQLAWDNPDTTKCLIDGYTTNATSSITIRTVGDSIHAGKWTTTAYRLEMDPGFNNHTIDIDDDYVTIIGLQFGHTGSGSSGSVMQNAGDNFSLFESIVQGGSGKGLDCDGTVNVRNSLFYDNGSDGVLTGGNGISNFWNCTFVDNGGSGVEAFYTTNWVNCLATNNTADDYSESGSSTYTLDYCASEDSTADNFSGANNNVDISTTTLYLDYSNDDFHLQTNTTADVKDNGIAIIDSLISYWKLDDTDNANALDAHASNDGTQESGVVDEATGQIVTAFSFDNVDDYVALGDIDITGEFSMSAWVFLDATHNSNSVIISHTNSGDDSSQYVCMVNDTEAVSIEWGDDPTNEIWNTSSGAVGLSAWHHIVITRNATLDNVEIYIDGVDQGATQSNASALGASDTTQIGKSKTFSGSTMDGTIDEVGIWDRILNQVEAISLYNFGRGLAYPLPGIDIDFVTRAGTWDIGCDEFVGAVPPAPSGEVLPQIW